MVQRVRKKTAATSPRGHGQDAKAKKKRPTTPPAADNLVRLQKVLADAGLGSRRKCEELIVAGRVEVDGTVVSKLGSRADPRRQKIRVDGELLAESKRVYFMVHKPPGVLSTNDDPAGRIRVVDFVPADSGRVYTVGRLDKASSGLIVVTNDGELANLLTHPRYGVDKTYRVVVVGVPSREVLASLEKGVHLAEGLAKAQSVRIHSRSRNDSVLEMVLAEGRNREIRRLLARMGHKVLTLRRIAIGRLRLGKLAPGDFRPLKAGEVHVLRQSVGGSKRTARKGRRSGTASRSRGLPKVKTTKKKKAMPRKGGTARPKAKVPRGGRGRRG